MNYESILESLLFISGDEGLSVDEIKSIFELDNVDDIIDNLKQVYQNDKRGLDIAVLGNRLKLITKKENKQYIMKMISFKENENLSEAALETLAIIAYNQPVTRIMVDEIRGVSSSHIVRKLVYKNLICEVGRSEAAGRPILYGTTPLFLDYFGLNSIKELPIIEVEKNDSIKDLYNSKYNEETN